MYPGGGFHPSESFLKIRTSRNRLKQWWAGCRLHCERVVTDVAERNRRVIFIFGFRGRAAVLATVSLACRNGHLAAHRIVKLTRWFTLFFVPVIPFSRKYRSICIQCGLTLEIPKEAAEEIASGVSNGAGPVADPIAPPLPSATYQPDPALPPAGWYPDPAGGSGRRYWDGHSWTQTVEQF